MHKSIAHLYTLAAALACIIMLASASASAAPGWRYVPSHGMVNCVFAVPSSPSDSINGGVVASASRAVTVAGQLGSMVTLRLICRRDQKFDSNGQLTSIGREGTYASDSLGGGETFGVDRPGDRSDGYELPKGREWQVVAGASPATYILTWSGMNGASDSIAVTVQSLQGPASLEYVQDAIAPVSNRANEAYDAATSNRGYMSRAVSITGNFALALNSVGQDHSATMGWGLDLDAYFGPRGAFKGIAGLSMEMHFNQVPAYAPGLPSNGFNAYTNGERYYVGPKIGGSYMPVSWFDLRFWGSLGALVNVWDTIPISQLPDRTLYSGESQTMASFGYKAAVEANFVLGEHFVVGPSVGLLGNISQLPLERGPERVCSAKDGSCLVQRQGNFLDVPLMFKAGATF